MKTAISIPDTLFRKAEREARRRGISLSRFYARALDEYLRKASDVGITQKLNEIYAAKDSRLDPALATISQRRLREAKW
ncbi:MAG: hypothetical protein WD873_01095 [Candidatus Hydrogenedentales bacterium]